MAGGTGRTRPQRRVTRRRSTRGQSESAASSATEDNNEIEVEATVEEENETVAESKEENEETKDDADIAKEKNTSPRPQRRETRRRSTRGASESALLSTAEYKKEANAGEAKTAVAEDDEEDSEPVQAEESSSEKKNDNTKAENVEKDEDNKDGDLDTSMTTRSSKRKAEETEAKDGEGDDVDGAPPATRRSKRRRKPTIKASDGSVGSTNSKQSRSSSNKRKRGLSEDRIEEEKASDMSDDGLDEVAKGKVEGLDRANDSDDDKPIASIVRSRTRTKRRLSKRGGSNHSRSSSKADDTSDDELDDRKTMESLKKSSEKEISSKASKDIGIARDLVLKTVPLQEGEVQDRTEKIEKEQVDAVQQSNEKGSVLASKKGRSPSESSDVKKSSGKADEAKSKTKTSDAITSRVVESKDVGKLEEAKGKAECEEAGFVDAFQTEKEMKTVDSKSKGKGKTSSSPDRRELAQSKKDDAAADPKKVTNDDDQEDDAQRLQRRSRKKSDPRSGETQKSNPVLVADRGESSVERRQMVSAPQETLNEKEKESDGKEHTKNTESNDERSEKLLGRSNPRVAEGGTKEDLNTSIAVSPPLSPSTKKRRRSDSKKKDLAGSATKGKRVAEKGALNSPDLSDAKRETIHDDKPSPKKSDREDAGWLEKSYTPGRSGRHDKREAANNTTEEVASAHESGEANITKSSAAKGGVAPKKHKISGGKDEPSTMPTIDGETPEDSTVAAPSVKKVNKPIQKETEKSTETNNGEKAGESKKEAADTEIVTAAKPKSIPRKTEASDNGEKQEARKDDGKSKTRGGNSTQYEAIASVNRKIDSRSGVSVGNVESALWQHTGTNEEGSVAPSKRGSRAKESESTGEEISNESPDKGETLKVEKTKDGTVETTGESKVDRNYSVEANASDFKADSRHLGDGQVLKATEKAGVSKKKGSIALRRKAPLDRKEKSEGDDPKKFSKDSVNSTEVNASTAMGDGHFSSIKKSPHSLNYTLANNPSADKQSNDTNLRHRTKHSSLDEERENIAGSVGKLTIESTCSETYENDGSQSTPSTPGSKRRSKRDKDNSLLNSNLSKQSSYTNDDVSGSENESSILKLHQSEKSGEDACKNDDISLLKNNNFPANPGETKTEISNYKGGRGKQNPLNDENGAEAKLSGNSLLSKLTRNVKEQESVSTPNFQVRQASTSSLEGAPAYKQTGAPSTKIKDGKRKETLLSGDKDERPSPRENMRKAERQALKRKLSGTAIGQKSDRIDAKKRNSPERSGKRQGDMAKNARKSEITIEDVNISAEPEGITSREKNVSSLANLSASLNNSDSAEGKQSRHGNAAKSGHLIPKSESSGPHVANSPNPVNSPRIKKLNPMAKKDSTSWTASAVTEKDVAPFEKDETWKSAATGPSSRKDVTTITKLTAPRTPMPPPRNEEDSKKTGVDKVATKGTAQKRKRQLTGRTHPIESRKWEKSHLAGKSRLNLERVKLIIFSVGKRAHKGFGYEKLFAEYWEALSLRIEGNLSDAEFLHCRNIIESFLKTKTLRMIHNKLIMELLARCFKQTAPYKDIPRDVSLSWRQKIKTVPKLPAKGADQQLLASATRQKTPERAILSDYCMPFFRELEPPKSQLYECIQKSSLRIPGAIIVDPLVKGLAQNAGMKVSENAVWLLVVAMKEYTKSLLGNSINFVQAMQEGQVAPLASTKPTMIQKKTVKPSDKSVEPVKCITSRQFHAFTSNLPTGVARSLSSRISRTTYERSLFSSHENYLTTGTGEFQELKDFITSSIMPPLSKRRKTESGPQMEFVAAPRAAKPKPAQSTTHTVSRTSDSQGVGAPLASLVPSSGESKTEFQSARPLSIAALRNQPKGEQTKATPSVAAATASGKDPIHATTAMADPLLGRPPAQFNEVFKKSSGPPTRVPASATQSSAPISVGAPPLTTTSSATASNSATAAASITANSLSNTSDSPKPKGAVRGGLGRGAKDLASLLARNKPTGPLKVTDTSTNSSEGNPTPATESASQVAKSTANVQRPSITSNNPQKPLQHAQQQAKLQQQKQSQQQAPGQPLSQQPSQLRSPPQSNPLPPPASVITSPTTSIPVESERAPGEPTGTTGKTEGTGNQKPQTVAPAPRRGKGFGIKNLAAMRARSQHPDEEKEQD